MSGQILNANIICVDLLNWIGDIDLDNWNQNTFARPVENLTEAADCLLENTSDDPCWIPLLREYIVRDEYYFEHTREHEVLVRALDKTPVGSQNKEKWFEVVVDMPPLQNSLYRLSARKIARAIVKDIQNLKRFKKDIDEE